MARASAEVTPTTMRALLALATFAEPATAREIAARAQTSEHGVRVSMRQAVKLKKATPVGFRFILSEDGRKLVDEHEQAQPAEGTT